MILWAVLYAVPYLLSHTVFDSHQKFEEEGDPAHKTKAAQLIKSPCEISDTGDVR